MRQAGTKAGDELALRYRTGRDGADSPLLPEVRGSGRADVSRPELTGGRPRLERGAGLHRPGLHRTARKLLGLVRLVAGRRAAGAARPVKPRCPRKPCRTGRTGQRKLARPGKGTGIRTAVKRARFLLSRELLSRELLCRKLLPLAERPGTWRTGEGPGARSPVAGCGPAGLPERDVAVARETNAIRHPGVCCSAVGPVAVLHTARSRGVGPARIRLPRLGAVPSGAAVRPVTPRRAAWCHAPGKRSRILRPRLLCPEWLLCSELLLCPIARTGHRRTILAACDRAPRPDWPGWPGARRARALGPWASRRHALPAWSAWHWPAWPAARVTAAAAAVRPAFTVHTARSRPAPERGAGSVTWTHRHRRSARTGSTAPTRSVAREILAGTSGESCRPVARAPVVGQPGNAVRPGPRARPEVGV